MTNTEALATRMARAEKAFTRHIVDKVSLRDLGPELGVSYETVRQDAAAYQQYLAANGPELAERRAAFVAELEGYKAKALYVFEKYKDTKPLTAVAALNSAITTLTHQRAVQGLDMPREAKIEQSGEVRIVWDDGTIPIDAGYGEVSIVPTQRD